MIKVKRENSTIFYENYLELILIFKTWIVYPIFFISKIVVVYVLLLFISCVNMYFYLYSLIQNELYMKVLMCEPNIHSDFSRLARWLSGMSVGLVLGGGGARGAAHVGMIKAIQV